MGGRPERNFSVLLQSWLSEDFQTSVGDEPALYGEEYKTTKRWGDHQDKEFKEYMEQQNSEPKTYDEALVLLKSFLPSLSRELG